MAKTKKKRKRDAKAKPAVNGSRLVEIEFQRVVSEYAAVIVAVPGEWSDEQVAARASDMYDELAHGNLNWAQRGAPPGQGEHYVRGAPLPGLIFPLKGKDRVRRKAREEDDGESAEA
jgi:hypothetical protein